VIEVLGNIFQLPRCSGRVLATRPSVRTVFTSTGVSIELLKVVP